MLTRPETLNDPGDLRVGEHGLIIESGRSRGLLLPQVASDRNWDSVQFLREVSMKAGLHQDAWQLPEVRLHVFSALVFSEQDSNG